MFSGLWKRSLFMGIKKNARRDKRLKRPRVLPSLERLEARELLSTATPSYIIESTQQGSAAPASRGHPASPPASPPPVTYTPTQIENAYGFNQISFASYTGSNGLSLPGTGQTIAIVDAYNDPDIWSNLETFDAEYGLVNPNLTVVNQSGTVLSTNGTSTGARTPSNNSSWAVEESLDVEWAHAIAPGANIVLVEANSASTSSLMTAVKTASTYAGVSVVSMSWGENESSGETSYDSDFTTPGVTYVGASGDSGSPPIYPATSPNVLAVGGTSLYLNSSGGYGSETVWNSDGGSSGGGISQYEPLPSYQPGTYSNGSTTGTSTMRMSPDVAYDADPNTGFLVYDTDGESGWLAVGGTSDAAPQWAALIAIANQGRQAANNNTPNPLSGSESLSMLYQMGTGSSSSTYFHDITTGSNGTYSAGPGYDLVTGLGTPIANNVVNYLVNGSSTSPSPSAPSITQQPTSQSVTAGSNVTFTATASGNPTPTVQWYVNSGSGWSALSNGTNISGATSTSLTLSSVTTAMSGYEYEAIFTNSAGTATSNAATLTVSASSTAPTITQQPTSQSVTAGSNVTFTATASGNPTPTVQWYVNSGSGWSALSNGTNISGATSTSLTLSSVTTAMSGYEYEAIFTNSAGTATSNVATLTVNSSSSSGLLSDGGFESPVLSPGSYVMDPSGTPWTFGGRAGIASNGSSVTGTLNAPQGTQVGFLSGFGSGFYQTVYLSTGTYYNLTFDAANVGRSQEIAVAVGGTILAEGTATSNQYTGYSTGAFYVTESGYYTVTFVGLNSRGGYALIDNVGLSATPAVKLSGSSSGALAQASLSGSSGLSGSSTSAVPASPGVASQSPLPSNHLSLNNTDLGWLTTLSSPTGPYFADQVFAQEQASMSGQLNSLFSAVFLSPLVTGLRSQATTDPFGEPLDWA